MPPSIRACVEYARQRLRSSIYWLPGGYQAERYWRDRHRRYGFDMRGVGDCGRTHAENLEEYDRAARIFLELCRAHRIQLPHTSMLEIGCGTGYYAEVFRQAGGVQYVGVDITDELLPDLRKRFPAFTFHKLDITGEPVPGIFDLIAMIDVTQHITQPDRFSSAMQHVRLSLGPRGVFVVTSWLSDSARHSFYEVSRSMDAYQREFAGFRFSEPVRYRDKFMFAITRS